MPNWTGNRLSIIGSVEDINLFEADRLAALKDNDCVIEGDHSQVITFNMVLPMPKELLGTTSPRPRTEEEIRRDAKLYNWPDEIIQHHLDHALSPEDAARLDELKAKYGSDNWYDWCSKNWGTKWDACHASIGSAYLSWHKSVLNAALDGSPLPAGVGINFDTAWAEPQPVIHALVRKYPKLNFVHLYSYEGEGNTDFMVDYRMNEGVLEAKVNITTNMTEYEPWEDVSHMVN